MIKEHKPDDATARKSTIAVLHELYLLPYEMSVKDGQVASIMCSYNRIGGVYALRQPVH